MGEHRHMHLRSETDLTIIATLNIMLRNVT